ncbi:MAG: MscL family protein, partial [Nocardioides sp.]
MSGFKNFILKGNLVELAVAFIMATAFAAVVTATVGMIL